MKYCCYCGAQLEDEAAFCSVCGKATDGSAQGSAQTPQQVNYQVPQQRAKDNETLKTVINVFLILACVVMGIATLGIGLAWCIPMTLKIRERMSTNCPVGIALKVCTLIFVSTVAGILLLVLDDGSN